MNIDPNSAQYTTDEVRLPAPRPATHVERSRA